MDGALPRKKSALPVVVGLVVAAALAAHGLSGTGHTLATSNGGSNGAPHVRHEAANRVINVRCPPGTPGSKLVSRWESTRTGPIFLKCASLRHFLRGHHPKGATWQQIEDCIAKTIEYAQTVVTYLQGANGHPPGHVYEWNWDESDDRLWTRVIVSLGDPGYITTAYPNAKRVLGDKGGDWIGCSQG